MSSLSAKASVSDEELACRAQQGCEESLDQLLRRFQTPVLHFLRRRGFSSDAEDVTQETFLRAYENLHRYNPRWTFSTWLFTIAHRTGVNYRRRIVPTTNGKSAEAATSPEPAPPDAAIVAESRSRLWNRAASVLSEEQTTALWLHYVEDMPARAIARVLGRSWASVKVMLFRARKRLLPLLGEFDDGPCATLSASGGTLCKGVTDRSVENGEAHTNPIHALTGRATQPRPSLAVELEAPNV